MTDSPGEPERLETPRGDAVQAVPQPPALPPPAAGPAPAPTPAVTPPQHVVTHSRMGAVWAAAIAFAVLLLLLLIFILENGQRVDVAYFGVHTHLPLGVALLLAAVFGVLLVVIPGVGRMVQLRWTAKRHRRLDAAVPVTPVTEPTVPVVAQDAPEVRRPEEEQ